MVLYKYIYDLQQSVEFDDEVCAATSVADVDVRYDSIDNCTGRTRKHRFGCTVGISDQWLVGWLDCACGYVDPQLLDLQTHCILPSHWHRHFSMCLSQ